MRNIIRGMMTALLAALLLAAFVAAPAGARTIQPAFVWPAYDWYDLLTCRNWERMHVTRQAWRMMTAHAAIDGYEWSVRNDPDQDGVPCEWVVGWADLPGHYWIPLATGGNYKLSLPDRRG